MGAVSAAALYVIRMLAPIGVLLAEVDEIQQPMAALARLVGVTLMPRQEAGAQDVPVRGPARLTFDVAGAGFAYVPGRRSCTAPTCPCRPGPAPGCWGSGAGKTTLGRLIAPARLSASFT